MPGEVARVEFRPTEGGRVCWLDVIVNGVSTSCPVHVSDHNDEKTRRELASLIAEVHRRAYRQGAVEMQLAVKQALGID